MKKKNKLWNLLLMTGLALLLIISCKKSDDSNNPTPNGTVIDIDGNVYHTVTIGTQVWMVENLKTTKYRNGDPIPNVTGGSAWAALTTGAYCWYNNDATTYKVTYGALYNWYAVADNRNIAPTGWHVSTDAEWTTLENYVTANLGTSGSVGKALAATTDWALATNTGAVGNNLSKNNASGFTALPGGNCGENGAYSGVDENGCWWSSTESLTFTAWYRRLNYTFITINTYNFNKSYGFSVRCVKD